LLSRHTRHTHARSFRKESMHSQSKVHRAATMINMTFIKERHANYLDRPCPELCGSLRAVTRVTAPEELKIPLEVLQQRHANEQVYHCSHCSKVWFQAQKSQSAGMVGLYRSSVFESINPPFTVQLPHRKSAKKASQTGQTRGQNQ